MHELSNDNNALLPRQPRATRDRFHQLFLLTRMLEIDLMHRNRLVFNACTLCECPPGKKEFLYPKFITL